MISALATGYLFLGGAGSGALFVLCVMECLRTIRPSKMNFPVISSELLCRGWSACLLSLSLGVVFLLCDLGNFEAAIYLLLNPQPVPLTIGAFALPLAIACSAAFLSMNAIDGVSSSVWTIRVLSVFGATVAAITMSYTGILLQSMAAVLAWQTPLVPILFVLSSLSCGVALVLGSVAFVETRAPLADLISCLLHCDSILIVLETATLALFVVMGLQNFATTDSIHAWIDGDLSPVFWIVLVGVGLIIPFIMEQLVTFSSHRHQLLFIAAAVLVGALAMRICVVGLSAYDPAQLVFATDFLNYNQFTL